MPRLRAEQVQNLTLTDAQIAINAAISQSKIASLVSEPNGWISKGIVNVVTTATLPTFDGTNAGRFYYNSDTDELWMATSTDPFKMLITGPSMAGFAEQQDLKTVVKSATESTDWNGTVGRIISVSPESISLDGSDSFVYLNGSLMKFGATDDYTITSSSTIQFTFDLAAEDRVSVVIITTAYMTNYATKAYIGATNSPSGATKVGVKTSGNLSSNNVQDALEELQSDIDSISGGYNLSYTMNKAYESGSIVEVDSTDVDFRLSTNKSFLVSDSSGSLATESYQDVLVGSNKNVEDLTGLQNAVEYTFQVGLQDYSISLNSTKYSDLLTKLNGATPDFRWDLVNGNIRCYRKIAGSSYSVAINNSGANPLFSSLTDYTQIQAAVLGTDGSSSQPILKVRDYASSKTVEISKDLVPTAETVNLGSPANKFGAIYAKDAYFDVNTIHLGADHSISVDNGMFKFSDASTGSEVVAILPDFEKTGVNTNLSAALNQNITMNSSGSGKTLINSASEINLAAPSVVLKGNIVPDMTGAVGVVSVRDIGTPTQKINKIYADEVFVGASSLYVNGKKVIEDVSDTMTFATDPDQSMNIKTSGVGNTSLLSDNQVAVNAKGGIELIVPSNNPSKNLNITNQSTNGNINFSSSNQITFTAPTVATANLTVSGNLTVQGTTTTVNTDQVNIKDNMIQLNSNQTGTPATSLVGGIEINRGDSGNYRFVFAEDTDTFRIGVVGSTQAVATREDSPATNGGVAVWDSTNYRFNTTSVTVSGSTITGTLNGQASTVATITKAQVEGVLTGSISTHTHANATTSVAGYMSSADKTKLDGVATNANNYSHPTGDGNLHVPATSTTNNGKVLKAGATAGSIAWGTLSASDVGLGNVNNTADVNKSVNYANTAGSAGSVAWTNVSGRPTAVSSFTNDSGYITSSGSISGNAATATTATYGSRLTCYGGEQSYKAVFTTNTIQNPGGSWGKMAMLYDGNSQTYGMRVDWSDWSDVAYKVRTSNTSPSAGDIWIA